MFLKKISLINFKNYTEFDLDFSTKINCFVGNNGVGKTNLLDAIYYLSFCKSFINSIDSQNIKHDENFFVIQGEYNLSDIDENIYCGLKTGRKKQFKRNKKDYERLSDHIGLLPLVLISPYDTNLINDGSEERRRFMNSVISQYDKQYLQDTIQYNNILLQRNALLKQMNKFGRDDADTIQIYNDQMIPLGFSIFEKRKAFIEELIPIFQEYYNFISDEREEINISYQSQLLESDFQDLLLNSYKKDKILQYTSQGIHKDDLLLSINNYPVKKIGSQGQQKTFLIALKFAQFDFMKKIYGYKPVLLLDDVFDKLDATRVEKIITMVADNHFGQIFITDTNKERVKKVLEKVEIETLLVKINDDSSFEKI
jgi:DNA replication and repair protein RecF